MACSYHFYASVLHRTSLYAAVADQLNLHGKVATPTDYKAARRAAAQEMRTHPNEYKPFISDSDEHMAGIENKEAGTLDNEGAQASESELKPIPRSIDLQAKLNCCSTESQTCCQQNTSLTTAPQWKTQAYGAVNQRSWHCQEPSVPRSMWCRPAGPSSRLERESTKASPCIYRKSAQPVAPPSPLPFFFLLRK